MLKTKKPCRSYSGDKWLTNTTNKKYLAIDFNNRCAYCDDHDKHNGGYNSYHVEHFAPKEKFDHLKFTYENLLYSCSYCNISKSDKWVGETEKDNVVGNEGFLDPCEDEYYKHLCRATDGQIKPCTELGNYIYKELKLYLLRHSILYNIDRIYEKLTLLEEKIAMNNKLGKSCETLNKLYSDLCVQFVKYYSKFVENV